MGIDSSVLYNIGYGLYVITSRDGERDNGFIANAVMQLTASPARVAVAINKNNFSHEIIKKTGKMNVCPISEDAPFSLFQAYGFVSGRDTDKFSGYEPRRSENGLAVIEWYSNSYMSLSVESYTDLGTHGLFICSLDEAERISSGPTMSYAYYHKEVKPKPKAEKRGYVCKICGHIYEGDTLPEDYICPICKHGAADFEKL